MKKKKLALIIGGICIIILLGGVKSYQVYKINKIADKIYETAFYLYAGLDKDGGKIDKDSPYAEFQKVDLITSLSPDCVNNMEKGNPNEIIVSSDCSNAVYDAMVSRYKENISQRDYKKRYSIRFNQ